MPAGTPDSSNVSRQQAIASYGYIAQLAEDVPDIRRLLDRALADGWTPQRFTAEVQQSAWWKATAESKRQVEVLKASDPAEYAKQLAKKRAAITILARQLGASLDTKQLDEVSARALEQAWDTSQMQRYVAAEIKVDHGTAKGQAGVTVDELKKRAADFFVPLSDATLQKWTEQILTGDIGIDAFDGYVREQAKSYLPSLAGSIDSGVTLRQWFAPYQQAAADLLEVPAESVDFADSTYRNAVFDTDPKTGAKVPRNLSDFKTWVRKQPAYAKTAQAREQAANLSNTLLQTFGKVSY